MRSRKRSVLTKAKIRQLNQGRHADGGGLYINVTESGSKSWVFRWVKDGRTREMGLGPIDLVELDEARDMAFEFRRGILRGSDPRAMRDKTRGDATTFGSVADEFLETQSARWSNEKTRWQWEYTLKDVAADLRKIAIGDVGTNDVVKLLKPIWTEMPEKARKTRMRIERVIDYATSKGLRDGENPARLKGHLENILPKSQKLSRGHHKAMAYKDCPRLMKKLRDETSVSASALRFTILTAARTGETINAVWSEIDWDEKLWIIPAERMKMKRDHRVPLNDEALAILKAMREIRMFKYVFPGQRKGKPLSNLAMMMLLRRLKFDDVTVHGFRSSFRDWAGDKTDHAREIVEHALAHKVGNDVELAYRRNDAIEKRRVLMNDWEAFLNG